MKLFLKRLYYKIERLFFKIYLENNFQKIVGLSVGGGNFDLRLGESKNLDVFAIFDNGRTLKLKPKDFWYDFSKHNLFICGVDENRVLYGNQIGETIVTVCLIKNINISHELICNVIE